MQVLAWTTPRLNKIPMEFSLIKFWRVSAATSVGPNKKVTNSLKSISQFQKKPPQYK